MSIACIGEGNWQMVELIVNVMIGQINLHSAGK
jgi:hypothetical protein